MEKFELTSGIGDEFNQVMKWEVVKKYTLTNFKVLDLLIRENDRMMVDEASFKIG